MKPISSIILLTFLFLCSCSTDSDDITENNEIANLVLVETLENDFHEIELFSESGHFEEGYNELFLRIKDKDGETYYKDAAFEWRPIMHMENSHHSAPRSPLSKMPDTESLFSGYIIFQMAQNATEAWSLSLDYRIGKQEYTLNAPIEVLPSARKRVSVFIGADQQKYILALVSPTEPAVATNQAEMALYRMQDMEFHVVDNYQIKIDPRMPGMGNHSSPNNVDLSQQEEGELYSGKLNLTMSGFWRINLQLLNEDGVVVKGELVTETNERSSLNLELEF